MISVVIPTYNRADKLALALRSVAANAYQAEPVEIIVVDDHGSDRTPEVIHDLQEQTPHTLIYLRNGTNRGPAASRNRGIRAASGRYIFFTDDDCLVPPRWLHTFVDHLDAHPSVYGVGGSLQPAQVNWIAALEKLKDRALGIHMTQPVTGRQGIPIGFTNNLAYRREVFSSVGLFNESFRVPAGEDVEFKNRVILEHDVSFLPLPVIHNHRYDMDYLAGLLFKQGLNRTPPRGRFWRYALLVILLPALCFTVLKKSIQYRQQRKS